MNKRFLSIVALLMAFTLIFVGCSQQAEKSATSQPQPAKEKELTLDEVLTKSEEAMAKGKGISYQTEGKQNIGMQGSTIATDMNLEINMTNQPRALYAKGKVKALGQEMPMEMYLVDDMMYQHVAGQWVKMKGFDLNQAGMNNEDPSEMVKQLKKIIQSLGGGKNPKGLTMKKENGTYVVTVDSAAVQGSKEFLDGFVKGMKGSLEATGDMKELGGAIDFNKVKLESYKETYYIDEKTFELKNIDHESKITIPLQGQNLTAEQKMKITVKGAFDGKIEVPADVKKKAKSIS